MGEITRVQLQASTVHSLQDNLIFQSFLIVFHLFGEFLNAALNVISKICCFLGILEIPPFYIARVTRTTNHPPLPRDVVSFLKLLKLNVHYV